MSTTPFIMARIGRSIREYRLDRDMGQQTLAEKAGASLSTIKKVESGGGCNLDTFINIMRALSRLDDLEQVLPVIKLRPTERLALERKIKPRRKRASAK